MSIKFVQLTPNICLAYDAATVKVFSNDLPCI